MEGSCLASQGYNGQAVKALRAADIRGAAAARQRTKLGDDN